MTYAIIGGSLLTRLEGGEIEKCREEVFQTPYGEPSSPLLFCQIHGQDVIYLHRHGKAHTIAPHQVNYRANIFALYKAGVTGIIASAAVGGISRDMPPLQCVVPDQLIDYTYGREHSFNELDDTAVNHIDFSYPFSEYLRQCLIDATNSLDISCKTQATYGVTQGPRLETAAEINRLKNDGCDIVGMTAMPEAALARELGMDYASCAIVVNWAAGQEPGEKNTTVSMDEIRACIGQGDQTLRAIVNAVLQMS